MQYANSSSAMLQFFPSSKISDRQYITFPITAVVVMVLRNDLPSLQPVLQISLSYTHSRCMVRSRLKRYEVVVQCMNVNMSMNVNNNKIIIIMVIITTIIIRRTRRRKTKWIILKKKEIGINNIYLLNLIRPTPQNTTQIANPSYPPPIPQTSIPNIILPHSHTANILHYPLN